MLDQSAMLSFYFLFSIFPLLLFLMTLLGLILESGQEFQNIYREKLPPCWNFGEIDAGLQATRR